MSRHEGIKERSFIHTFTQNQQKLTEEQGVAWNHTKNKLFRSDFLLILPTGHGPENLT